MSADGSAPELIEIDLNADVGEGCKSDKALLCVVTSCNVACGGHAGDDMTMAETVRLALKYDVVVGAHPGYPDRDNFGRVSGYLDGVMLVDSLKEQVASLGKICTRLGAKLSHVKPHGALYIDAITKYELADAIANVTAEISGNPALMGIAGSALQMAAERYYLEFIPEAFADRAYEADGLLVPRSEPGAVHTDMNVVVNQAVHIAEHKLVIARDGSPVDVAARTLCIHADTPGAARMACTIREALEHNEVLVRAYQIC